MHTHMQAHTYTHTHTHVRTHIHVGTNIYTQTHTGFQMGNADSCEKNTERSQQCQNILIKEQIMTKSMVQNDR